MFHGIPRRQKSKRMLKTFYYWKKLPKFSMKYRFHILLKYSSFSINNHKYSFDVTFDSSRRHKMFSSLSNVCDEMKRSPFLLKFTISCVPLTHMRLLKLLILAACRSMCKIWTWRTTSFRGCRRREYVIVFVRVFGTFLGPVLLLFHILGSFAFWI